MFNSLQDILAVEPANELIEPFDLTEADVVGSELVPIVTMGIFNPMGPTIMALNLVTQRDADSAGILCTVLNPFTQTRQIFARCGNDPVSLTSFLPNANRIGGRVFCSVVIRILFFHQPSSSQSWMQLSSSPTN